MAEADAKITIGADATAAKERDRRFLKNVQPKLSNIGQAFIGVIADVYETCGTCAASMMRACRCR